MAIPVFRQQGASTLWIASKHWSDQRGGVCYMRWDAVSDTSSSRRAVGVGSFKATISLPESKRLSRKTGSDVLLEAYLNWKSHRSPAMWSRVFVSCHIT